MKLSNIMFLSTLIMGTIITISSYSWFSMWMGLEINLLSFIPLISKGSMSSSEASMKYFFVQMLASMLIMFVILMSLVNFEMFKPLDKLLSLILTSSLLMKLGMAPFHFWFIEVIEGMTWMMSLILLTWQKIAPMIVIQMNSIDFNFLNFIVILAMIISGLKSWNQASMKKILALSSINHMGWMMSILLINQSIWMVYFLIYSFMNIVLILMLKINNITSISQILNLKMDKNMKMLFFVNFMSLGGLPPFMGFYPKWLVLSALTSLNLVLMSIMMILSTMFMLYTYIQILAQSLMLKNIESKINFSNSSNLIMFLNFLNIAGLIIFTLWMNF
uniref:NADH dehydrogenase subunit 2 n=1 Tax=Chilocorus rubidus TaxID=419958 RepID=UPI00286AF551|nr:NADH dehydrogenase subunit 2 [Chilocorus rubidus]WMB96362.1 NADH dehydrogenase subunit 2 [Chilocorus rubidus]